MNKETLPIFLMEYINWKMQREQDLEGNVEKECVWFFFC